MAAKPIVDGISREHGSELKIIHLNIQDPAGKALLKQFDFRFTPTFIFFNGEGEELHRWLGSVDSAQVRDLMGGSPP